MAIRSWPRSPRGALGVSAVDALSQLYREPALAERNQQILRYQIELAAAAGAPYAITYFGFGGERDDRPP